VPRRRPSSTTPVKRLKGLSRELERLQTEAKELSTLVTELLTTVEGEHRQPPDPLVPRRQRRSEK